MTNWSKLREFHSAVLAEWGDFPREFLKKTAELSPSIPCAKGNFCSMRVVHHSDDDIVGVCSSELQFCDNRKLAKEELYIYALDTEKLANKLSSRQGVELELKEILPFKNLWRIGKRKRDHLGFFYMHIYLDLCSRCERGDFEKMVAFVNELACIKGGSYILIAPTDKYFSPKILEDAEKINSEFLTLEQVFAS